MKKLALLIVVLGLVWLVWTRIGGSAAPKAEVAMVPAVPEKPAVEAPRPAPAPAPIAPVPMPEPKVEPVVRTGLLVQAERFAAPPPPASAPGLAYPQMSLGDVLQPNNGFHDAVFGVSMTYPEGWSVQRAMRWGTNNRENTVFFKPAEGEATPSMYYQNYNNGAPDLTNPEALLREQAQKKEESRQSPGNDYKNDPGSFVFRQIEGNPSLSYFATYTQNEQVHAEYFMRILGPKGYVMFFVRGPAKDIQAIIPTVHQMGGTVKPP